jgi:peptidyl-prolyl cis-trans isomerase SurA
MKSLRTRLKTAVIAMALVSALGIPCAARAELSARTGQIPAEVIDRIVATVNGHIILQSDWDQALCYEALLSGRALSQFGDDDRRAVLDQLIDQELLGEQMKSSLFQHASEAEATSQVDDAKKLYPEASTDQGWQEVLGRFRLTEKDVIAHVQQEIDLMRLVDAHLRPAVQIDSKTVEAYYRDKFIPQLKQTGAGDVPLADVSGKIRELLTQEKVSELLVSWLQSLRSESKVSVPGASSEGVQTQ